MSKHKKCRVTKTHDILSDALTRMRNAVRAKKQSVLLPGTGMVLEVLKVLSNCGYVSEYRLNEYGDVEVDLKVSGQYKINHLERVSRPGLRKYVSVRELKPVRGGRGISIISTSKGVVSGDQARKLNVGGEYLCRVW